jgi:hypothetical protein
MCGVCFKDGRPTEAWMRIEVFADEQELERSAPICQECVRMLVPELLLKALALG